MTIASPLKEWNPGWLLGGAVLLAGLALVVELPSWRPVNHQAAQSIACADTINTSTALNERQLAEFLTIPERYDRTQVRRVVQEPYCRLASLQIRPGVTAEREAYPLAFDPKNHLVILYEGEEYAGFTIGPR